MHLPESMRRLAERAHRGRRTAIGLGILLLAGCLGNPEVEDRWTNLDVLEISIVADSVLADSTTIDLRARITYRKILTGFVVAELRASQSLDYENVLLDFDQRKIGTSMDVNRILQNSATAGRATRGVTGYPQLVQTLDLSFQANIPAFVDGQSDPPGGPPRSLFLVLYMGDGDEIELADGRDSLVIDPFETEKDQILFKGFAVPLSASGP